MYGDYEAQRHWMEITTNLPVTDWYQNTTDNHLNYWGLDYPPLTAYHMFLCGKVANFINENFTKLHDSRGHESETHKLFMRYTVLLSDVALFIPSIIIYYYTCIIPENKQDNVKVKNHQKPKSNIKLTIIDSSLSVILALLYPGIILIDHGHFQYNSISLGLFIFATIFILHRKNILASVFFSLALNYKQMELYHSIPFFLYLLSICVPKPGQGTISGLFRLIKIGLTVIITFTIIWLPFIFDLGVFLQVLHRQFPIARGVFEDKVSNVWCALNIFYKFKNHFDNHQMMRLCLFTTLSAILPSSADLFLRPNIKKFVLSLINSSLAFFLFSFQVHEKTILLVAIPVLLYFPYSPFVCLWFLYISIFSMVPLIIKDKLLIALIGLTVFYMISSRICLEHAVKNSFKTNTGLSEYYKRLINALFRNDPKNNAKIEAIAMFTCQRVLKNKNNAKIETIAMTYQRVLKNKEALFALILHLSLLFSVVGSITLFVFSVIWEPPIKYPDLYPLLISLYSCVHFLGFFVYFNVKQFSIPQEFDDIKYVKVKAS